MSTRPKMTFVSALATLFAGFSLSAVFDDGSWFWPVVAAVTAGALGCALGRRIGLPRLVVPLVGLVGVVLMLTWLDARDVAVLGLFPGPGAMRALDELVREGLDGIRRYTTPAPTDPGLVLIAAFGVGVVAVVVDTLAVGYRSAALAGGPLLLLYAVPLTVVRSGVPVLLFLFAAAGWLALMLAEGRERLSGWGRALGRRSKKEDDPLTYTPPDPLGVVGRRIGAAAMCLALVVPVLMPWSGTSLFKSGGSGGGSGQGGGGKVNQLSPIAQLGGWLQAKQETPLITYTTDDQSPEYLRVVTDDTFDGTTWRQAQQRPAESASQMPTLSEGIDGPVVKTSIQIVGLSQDWLPVTYPGGSGIDGLRGSWSYDADTLDVFRTGNSNTTDQEYTVTSRHIQPTVEELQDAPSPPADVLAKYTALPSGIPQLVLTRTRQVLAGAQTEYDKALALQQYFIDPKNGFRYTTTPDLPGNNPLVGFLTAKQGFCQQFAGTYAVMARLAGLPTRLEIGFTPGGSPDRTGRRTITNRNAHAWPEVYFTGIGWVRFEPTASAPFGVAQPGYALAPGAKPIGSQGGGEHSGPNNRLQQDLDNGAASPVVNLPKEKTPGTTAEPGSFPWALVIVVAALVLLLVPTVARTVRRRRRLRAVPPGLSADEARERVRLAWLEVAETSVDLREPWPLARTPRRTADWVATVGLSTEAGAAAYRLARAVERSRYARDGVDVLAGTDPAADARTICRALESTAPRRDRWQARLAPQSVLAHGSEWFADLLDRLDEAGARARGWMRRLVSRRPVATDG